MSLWRQLTRGLRVLVDRTAADRDVADEVQDYYDHAAAELIANGVSPEDARRRARLQLGNMTVVREQVGSYGWENLFATFAADLRYATRRLVNQPGFTIVSMITLALGIGASTAIFSAVNPVLFAPLPYPKPQQIVTIWDWGRDRVRLDLTFGTYRELTARSPAFAAMAAMKPWQPTLLGTPPERLDGQRVSASYFQVLGVQPALGRNFDPSDDRLNGPKVAILSDGLWRRRFAADAAIVGRDITLNDTRYTVLGVMPRGFENVLAPSAELWSLLQYDMSIGPAWGHHLRVVARLADDTTLERARDEIGAIARAPISEFARPPWAALRDGLLVDTLQHDVTGAVRPALLALLGAVALVLTIASLNVTNLLLARGAQRHGEFAMRAALGASRGRMMRQLLTESLLLASLGGLLGMVVAAFGLDALVALAPPGLPRAAAMRIDATVFAFGLLLTTLVGILLGVMPALHASRNDLHAGVNESNRRAVGGHQLTRRVLVVAEVALALVLLVSAGLLLRSLQRLFAVAPGIEPARVLTMQVQTSGPRFDDDAAVHQFFTQALEAVRRVPGVEAAAFTSQLPLSGDSEEYGVHFETRDEEPRLDRPAFRYAVSPGYFETIGTPLRRGRLLDAHDLDGAARVALLNESFARRTFPGADAIGKRLRVGANDGPWATVVGIVGDVKQTSLAVTQSDAVYIPSVQGNFADRTMSLVVRARGDAAALLPAVSQAIWSVDKDQAIARIATMERVVEASAAERRFALTLFEAFALVALVLAATGIYGVLSGSVTERMPEIGVRSALGASRSMILTLIMGQGLALTIIGVAIGLAGALAASRSLTTLLYGISRLDPPTYVAVVALLTGTSALACWIPAWRASRVDPAITLRAP